MSDSDHFVGYWKVLDCAPVAVSIDPKGIRGTVFQLSKTGEVIWKIPQDAVQTPLFKCDTYEVVSKKPYLSNSVVRFGAYKGHIIDCTVKTCEPYSGIISINDGWCLLVCKKFKKLNQEDPFELPFSFFPALQDGYFSDLTINADNQKEFKVHSCILKLSLPEVDWSTKPSTLSNFSEDVVYAILHFLYAQCLPSGLKESTIKNIIFAASQIPGLDNLVSLCHLYIRNMTLKNQIFSLVSDIHTCASQIIEYFTNKHSSNSLNNLTSDPAKLCFAVKNSMREVAVAEVKLLMICDLYAKQKNELSREEEHEIIFHARSMIPVFMSQLENFLQAVKMTFSDLLPSQRQELACYLVPEIETIFDTISSLLIKVKTVLEMMLTDFELEEEADSQRVLENLEQYADSVLHRKEVNKLRGMTNRITGVLLHLHQKKENFKLMSNGNKIRSVARNLEQLAEELPIIVLRIEEFISVLNEKLQWNESQFYFKVGTSKMSEIIKKMVIHKTSLRDLLNGLCDLVQRDSFSHSLVALGLLESSLPLSVSTSEKTSKTEDVQTLVTDNLQMNNFKDFVCTSPPASRNRLSQAAGELLKSGTDTDVIFEIITSGESDGVGDQTEKASFEPTELKPEVCKMAAHRVIIASRCDWFRRALLSGMQEDITRKIQVHNTNPYLFSLFLKYLYTGRLDCLTLSVDQMLELLLLSDRYDLDSLKQVCECGLKTHLDTESVLYFYNMADRFNAKILKSACEKFIAQNPEVIDGELFEELPGNLQSEVYDIVYDMVICKKPQPVDLPLDNVLLNFSYKMTEIEDMIASVSVTSNTPSPDNEVPPITQDALRLEATLTLLREIVGHEVSRSHLVQVIIAADYDLNRALNFYYSSS